MTPEETVEFVAETYGQSPAGLYGRRRFADITWARHVAWHVLREAHRLSYQRIGEMFGRDHATVMQGVCKVRRFAETHDRDPYWNLIDEARPAMVAP